MKILVNTPQGEQEIIEVNAGGGYFDPVRVIWNEAIDGPLPAITIGGMKRVGNTLVLDNTLLVASAGRKLTQQAAAVRANRNARLAATDWTQIADSTADKPAWAAYRQALRDVPSQAGFPQSVTWPQEP